MPPMSTAISRPDRNPWLGVWAIALGAFAIVVAEFLPIGLLAGMSRDLDISEGVAAMTVTSTALFACVAAPVTTMAIGQRDRKWILLSLTALLMASNALSAVAASFVALILARIVLGVALGSFWAVAVTAAGKLVPRDKVGAASSLVFAGIAVASVVAVPAGSYIGGRFDWRIAFTISGLLSLTVALAQVLLLPPILTCQAFKLAQFANLLKSQPIRRIFYTILLIVAGQYAGFTFITPYLEQIGGMSGDDLNVVLLGYGLMAVAGNFLGGMLAGRNARSTVSITAFVMLMSVSVLAAFPHQECAACLSTMIWALAWGMAPVSTQLWLFSATRGAAEPAQAINTSAFQLSISSGSFVGGLAVSHTGLHSSMWLGAGILLLALVSAALTDQSGKHND